MVSTQKHFDARADGPGRGAGLPVAGLPQLALEALQTTERPIALVGHDAQIVYANRAFQDLFSAPDAAGELEDVIRRIAAVVGRRGMNRRLRDGRTMRFSSTRITSGFWISAEDISEHVAAVALAAAQARCDPLTRIGNRILFDEALQNAAEAARLRGEPAAVLVVDIDRFKSVNDTLGHPIGDKLLKLVAERIHSVLAPGEICGRLGGDEFAVLQRGEPQPEAGIALAARLVDILGRSCILDTHLIHIGASVGLALLPAHGVDAEEAVQHADLALYRAKQDGRGTYRVFEPAMDLEARERRSLELDLRRCMALGELSLVYQPQFNIASGRVTGFEALLRWNSRRRGQVPPAVFIPIAEEIGLIGSIGDWVLRTACREAASWGSFNIAVNISAAQFDGPCLFQTVASALAASRLDPRRLELEITESVLMTDKARTIEILHRLRRLGVRISMDDFGTGYSSLSYLRSFPFDSIKIDQSFVRSGLEDASGAAIIRVVAALGESLGMTTVAEGVETAEQLARISAEGCTDAQGYFIGRPLTPDGVADYLRGRGLAGQEAART